MSSEIHREFCKRRLLGKLKNNFLLFLSSYSSFDSFASVTIIITLKHCVTHTNSNHARNFNFFFLLLNLEFTVWWLNKRLDNTRTHRTHLRTKWKMKDDDWTKERRREKNIFFFLNFWLSIGISNLWTTEEKKIDELNTTCSWIFDSL